MVWDVFVQAGKTGMGCFVWGVKKWHGVFCPRTFCPAAVVMASILPFNTIYRE